MSTDDERCFGCKYAGQYPKCLKKCRRFPISVDSDIRIKERHGLINHYERDLSGVW